MKTGLGKTPLLFLSTLLLVLVVLAASNLQCSKDSPRPNYNPERKPPGHLYFLTENPTRIYRYRIDSDHLEVLVERDIHGNCFAISQKGDVLAYISQDSLTVSDFIRNRTTSYALPYQAMEEITVSFDGSLIAFEAAVPGGSIIALFGVDSEAFFDFTTQPSDSSRFPVFSRYNPRALAWTQRDGLYFSYPNQAAIKLSDSTFRPYDFSPTGQYLATDVRIFNLLTKVPLLFEINGKSHFLDQNTVLFYEETTRQVWQTDLAGTNQEVLIGSFSREFPFTGESSGRFVAYFSNEPSGNRLFIFNRSTGEFEVEADFGFSGGTTVACLFWPDTPLIDNGTE